VHLRATLELIGIAIALVAGAAMGARRVRLEYTMRLDAERRLREAEESRGQSVRAALRDTSTVNGRIIRHALKQINDLQATEAALLELLDSQGRAAALVESMEACTMSQHPIHLADAIAQVEEDGGDVTLLDRAPNVMVLGPSAPHLVGSLSALLADLRARTTDHDRVGVSFDFSDGRTIILDLLAPDLAELAPDLRTLTALTRLGDAVVATRGGWRVTLPAVAAQTRPMRQSQRREVYA